MKGLLQEDIFDEGLVNKIASYLALKNIEYKLVKYRPFDYNADYNFFDDNNIFVYGSINLIQNIQRRYKSGNPIAYADGEAFKCSSYYPNYTGRMFNHDAGYYKFDELSEKTNEIFKNGGKDGHVFMRPNTNDKSFAGQLVSYSVGHQFCEYINQYVENDDIIVISEPKEHKEEYRFVVCNNEVITGSLYNLNNRHVISDIIPDRVLEYAQKIASNIDGPHPIYVLDIVNNDNDHLRVMEIGSINCAGGYGCDVEKIIDVCEELNS